MAPPKYLTQDRAQAALVAAAVGDALGWPMEDRGNRVGGTARVKPAAHLVEWQRREGAGFAPHEETVAAGTYSDDTQLLMAVARSRLRGDDWYRHLVEAELPVWLLYERGGGGAVKRAAQAWARGRAPWDRGEKEDAIGRYFVAGGNGVAMRCLPHAVFGAGASSFEQVRHWVDQDGLATHGHPRALIGARLFSWAVWWALRRREKLGYGELIDRVIAAESTWSELPRTRPDWHEARDKAVPLWEQEWHQAIEESLRYLAVARNSLHHGALAIDRETLKDIGFFGREKGAGTVTAAAAVFLAARYTSQPQQGLLAAAFTRNSDSDTLASMTGGLLGALTGGDWLGGMAQELQDSRYIKAVATWLSAAEGPEPPTLQWQRQMKTQLYRELEAARPGDTIQFPLFGTSAVIRITDHGTRSDSFIRAWLLHSAIGQSLSVKRYDRGRDGKPRWSQLSLAHQPSRASKQQHVGLVREVADLDVACRFYEEVVGLTRERISHAYVSFGWLALELACQQDLNNPQVSLTDSNELGRSRQAIRVYIDTPALVERHKQLAAAGLPVGPVVEKDGRRRFRCADPDGYVVEFCARNGSNQSDRNDDGRAHGRSPEAH